MDDINLSDSLYKLNILVSIILPEDRKTITDLITKYKEKILVELPKDYIEVIPSKREYRSTLFGLVRSLDYMYLKEIKDSLVDKFENHNDDRYYDLLKELSDYVILHKYDKYLMARNIWAKRKRESLYKNPEELKFIDTIISVSKTALLNEFITNHSSFLEDFIIKVTKLKLEICNQ